MIFGFRKKKEVEEEEQEEREQVLFQGPLNEREVDLSKNSRLVQAGLAPAKHLVSDALDRRAGMLRIDPKGQNAVVRLLIDGVAYPGGRLSKQQATAVTQILKLLAGLDTKERKKPQSGGMHAEFAETPYKLYVNSKPIKGGAEQLTLRVQNLNETLETPEDVGVTDELKEKIREWGSHNHGVMLCCGPPKSGTTTTAFAAVRSIDAYLYAIYSLRDLGDWELPGVTPFEASPDDDLETTLKRVVRQEANVVFVDPVRDAETAKTLFNVQDQLTVLSEMPAQDPSQAILQLCKWLGDPKTVAHGLNAILTQKLIRTLCTECREAYKPNPKLISKVGLPEDTKVLYRPPKVPQQPSRNDEYEPCPHCRDIGYRGRTAMFGYVEMTDAMRELIAKGPTAEAIKKQAKQDKMLTLQQDGLRLVAEGKTSLEELQRVFKSQ